MPRAGFQVVDSVDCAQIHGIHGEAVKGVGRECYDVACTEGCCHAGDKLWLRLVWMNAEHLCDQGRGILLGMTLPHKEADITDGYTEGR